MKNEQVTISITAEYSRGIRLKRLILKTKHVSSFCSLI